MLHPNMEQFQAFASSKPRSERYDFDNGHICACGQFAEAIDLPNWHRWQSSPDEFWHEANRLASVRPHTFGALAMRVAHHREQA